MAMVNSYNPKMRKSLPKQAMLKDYLLDDLSSCSSNGFRSLPRRPCGTSTVRFNPNQKQKPLKKNKPKSLLQRAIAAAAKLLSSGAKPPGNSPAKIRCSILPRGLKRWKPIKYLAASNAVNDGDGAVEYNGGYFNSDYLQCSRGNFESKIEDDVSPESEVVSGGVGEIVGGDSNEGESSISTPTTSSKENKWQKEGAKEQFSPVGVLDFTSTDEEEVSSPDQEVYLPFQSRLDCVQGRKKKLMQKLQRFELLAKLEPMDLSKKFSSTEQIDESINSTSPSPSNLKKITHIQEEDEEEREREEVVRYKVLNLLDQMKTTFKNYKFDTDIVLFDFFVEGISEKNGIKFENELISQARDWMKGCPRETFLGWEEAKNRGPYMRDLEKEGKWKIRAFDEHKEEVAFELEIEVLALLVNELVIDLI